MNFGEAWTLKNFVVDFIIDVDVLFSRKRAYFVHNLRIHSVYGFGQEAQLLQRGRAMLHFIEYIAKSVKVTCNGLSQ